MPIAPFDPTQTDSYRALRAGTPARIADLFAADPARASRYSLEAAGLFLDYSKNSVNDRTLGQLLQMAQTADLRAWIERMFAGEAINNTEHRAAWHVMLRAGTRPEVQAVLARVRDFCSAVRDGGWRGATDLAVTDIVNIGIGGSDLGPKCVCRALRGRARADLRAHFVANVDGAQLHEVLAQLDPSRTLFVVTSKTFTTAETMANARAARAWLVAALGEDAVSRHFVAVSTNAAKVAEFGIARERMFEFWDWVGGRYSLWSAVGLSIALYLGYDLFERLLAGARAMDEHFRTAPLERNMPVILALLGYWHSEFAGASSRLVLAYSQDLELLVSHLQQLELESNGKQVTREGRPVSGATTPALWGGVGTDVQHSFMQWVHQSPQSCPVDFILPLRARHPYQQQQQTLVANCLAQSAALMRGKTLEAVRSELAAAAMDARQIDALAPHRVFPGNRSSNTILLPEVSPEALGALIALYEHRTFVQAVLWNINPFDQWGVEYGKQLAQQLEGLLAGDGAQAQDPSTLQLLERFRAAISKAHT